MLLSVYPIIPLSDECMFKAHPKYWCSYHSMDESPYPELQYMGFPWRLHLYLFYMPNIFVITVIENYFNQ